ncbi:uncharacterized protein G2W53_030935 [Senna tora]|uniref:Uncharacterized protein n=1 Tax=Senna tora TaxID=362788 RepID=A0A834WF19_9FABA|nr:uncharacterized protein G2W53_030935 [Senna tora]
MLPFAREWQQILRFLKRLAPLLCQIAYKTRKGANEKRKQDGKRRQGSEIADGPSSLCKSCSPPLRVEITSHSHLAGQHRRLPRREDVEETNPRPEDKIGEGAFEHQENQALRLGGVYCSNPVVAVFLDFALAVRHRISLNNAITLSSFIYFPVQLVTKLSSCW